MPPVRILAVDDSEADRYLIAHAVRRFMPDAELHLAADGREALDLLLSGQGIDLVLLDINMPRMNGHQFLAEWSARTDAAPPVVVMLSSSNQDSDRERAMKYAMVESFLIKPLQGSDLQRLIA